jgi:hypothetical protein
MENTDYLTECILSKTPVSFLKYGDGEYAAASGVQGGNVDGDNYTETLKNGLRNSFKYMAEHAPNVRFAIWPFDNHIQFWQRLTEKPIQNYDYCSIIMEGKNWDKKVNFFKAIKQSTLRKVYVCNRLMVRAKNLLNIDHMVHVPFRNWVDIELDSIVGQLKTILSENNAEPTIVLTSAGMGAKILISELIRHFPNNIYLDIGSALDQVCTKRSTRFYNSAYETEMEYLKDLIPPDWESEEYNPIYVDTHLYITYMSR